MPSPSIHLRSNSKEHAGVKQLSAAVYALRRKLKEDGAEIVWSDPAPTDAGEPHLQIDIEGELHPDISTDLLNKLVEEEKKIDHAPNLYVYFLSQDLRFKLPEEIAEAKAAAEKISD